MRERNGVHTYDKRRTRSEIQAAFPAYDFEEGFTESDELWTSVYRETFGDVDRRARHVLDVIFHNDREQCGCRLSPFFLIAPLVGISAPKLNRGSVSHIDHCPLRFHC